MLLRLFPFFFLHLLTDAATTLWQLDVGTYSLSYWILWVPFFWVTVSCSWALVFVHYLQSSFKGYFLQHLLFALYLSPFLSILHLSKWTCSFNSVWGYLYRARIKLVWVWAPSPEAVLQVTAVCALWCKCTSWWLHLQGSGSAGCNCPIWGAQCWITASSVCLHTGHAFMPYGKSALSGLQNQTRRS